MTADISALALAALRGDVDSREVLADALEMQAHNARDGSTRRLLQRVRQGRWDVLVSLIPLERLDITPSEARELVGDATIGGYPMTQISLIPNEGRWEATVGWHGTTVGVPVSRATRDEMLTAARSVIEIYRRARGETGEITVRDVAPGAWRSNG